MIEKYVIYTKKSKKKIKEIKTNSKYHCKK